MLPTPRFPDARRIGVISDTHGLLRPEAVAALVVSGHTHRPELRREGGVLYLNPGSAGPRRFDLPVTLARLAVDGKRPEAELVELVAARRGHAVDPRGPDLAGGRTDGANPDDGGKERR